MYKIKYKYKPSAIFILAEGYNAKISEIDAYYLRLFAGLKLSDRLTLEEKYGQIAFLTREWERELQSLALIRTYHTSFIDYIH